VSAHVDPLAAEYWRLNRAPKSNQPCATYADLGNEIGTTAWLWNGFFPKGHVSMLVGSPGIGKSLVVLDIIKRALFGSGWPDGTPCEALSRVMIADTEGCQSVVLCRLDALGIPRDCVLAPFADPLRDLDLNGESFDEFRENVMRERPALIIIDSLAGASDSDEQSSRDMTRVLARLQRLARDADCVIVVVHHLRKRDESQPWTGLTLDSIRGSTAIQANCRAIWAIEPCDIQNGDGLKRFKCLKNNLADKHDDLGFALDECRVEWLPLPDAAAVQSEREKARAFLTRQLAGGPVPVKALMSAADGAGLAWRTVRRAKGDLGVVDTKQKGAHGVSVWNLPPTDRVANQ
jgi:putative DNA primase/helicase